jgi:hypothetical protein
MMVFDFHYLSERMLRDASIENVTLDVTLAQKKMLPCSFPKLVNLLVNAGT